MKMYSNDSKNSTTSFNGFINVDKTFAINVVIFC